MASFSLSRCSLVFRAFLIGRSQNCRVDQNFSLMRAMLVLEKAGFGEKVLKYEVDILIIL